jgi:transketolase
MRTAFIQQLTEEARRNPAVFLVVGDLGFSVVESFAAEFPDRFLNVGVAEQNMTGIAAGLAAEGFHVFTYSIGNFATLRCLEQIRNDVCYHGLSVTVVAVGAGMAYGNLGYSHHCIQDLGAMRGLPNIRILAPADPVETRLAVTSACVRGGPSYLRIGKANETRLHDSEPSFYPVMPLISGRGHTAICGTGAILSEAVVASATLKNRGVECDVVSLVEPTADHQLLQAALAAYNRVYVLEEHVAQGGIGELVAAILPRTVSVHRIAVPASLAHQVGSQQFLRKAAGMDADSIVRRISSDHSNGAG